STAPRSRNCGSCCRRWRADHLGSTPAGVGTDVAGGGRGASLPAAPTAFRRCPMSDISNAVDTVKDRLDQGVFDWDVTHGDLTDISRTVAGLSPDERNELVSELSDYDLKNWTQEIDGLSGSLSAQ